MNLKEIKEMINLMNDNGLIELEIEREGTKIRIKKQTSADTSRTAVVSHQDYVVEQIQQPALEAAARPAKLASNIIEIKSPMVGTFYRAAAPETPPFVDRNQTVEAGQVVCIIEAMKLMNEIKAEVKGTIKEFLVENGEPVEFGQVLFLIETT